MKLQKVWSDKLPSSTTKEYVEIVQVLNKRELLEEDAFFPIAETLEYPMENKAFQSVFKHYGVKGGSTGSVLTHVIYFTMKNGTRMELAIFFNDLAPEEEQKLEGWLDPFEAQVIFDAGFRERLKF
jgi:D-alanyl-D-alanine carboxypeptidase